MRTIRRLGQHDDDPLAGIANLFDLGIVLSLGFMVAAMVRTSSSPSTAAAAIRDIPKDHAGLLHNLTPSRDTLSGEGERLGVAYRLKSGEIVYVPESGLHGSP